MKSRPINWAGRFGRLSAAVMLSMMNAGGGGGALAQTFPALTRADFTPMVAQGGPVPQGFGDRQNSWAWSMAWFKGKLVVGTNRSYDCMVAASINRPFPFLPYPPPDPDELCTPDYRDLPLRAEIWTWDPATNLWARIYQSPADLPNPDNPAKPLARDVGYRYMYVFTESDGTEALYVSGLSSRFIYGNAVPGGRLLRSTDLVTFQAVPQVPGTVLGDQRNTGFRGITSYKGKMYIIAGTIEGNGAVLESANPSLGNNAFRVITKPGQLASELDVFNGSLYLSLSDIRGFRVVKTDAVEAVPGQGYTFKEVIPFGGGRTFFPNRDVWSMKPFNNKLYIGGNGVQSFFGAELYRINPDDTWDLVSGDPRTVNGIQKLPISGLGPGLGWGLNAHMWRQAVYDSRLYIGTFDMSTIFKDWPLIGALLSPEMGGDLWTTADGVFYSLINETGFEDRFNFGFRGLQTTPFGLFAGTANYWYGLEIYLGRPPAASTNRAFAPLAQALPAPAALEIEKTGGKTLLSWESSPGAQRYRIFRAVHQYQDGFQAKGAWWPVLLAGKLQPLTETNTPYFQDTTAVGGATYTYVVRAENASDLPSPGSNRVMYPGPTVTFRGISAFLSKCAATPNCFGSSSARTALLTEYGRAISSALNQRDLSLLRNLTTGIKAIYQYNNAAMQADAAREFELLLRRMAKRIEMNLAGLVTYADLQGY